MRGTGNVNNSFKKFSSKRKEKNGSVAELRNGVQRRGVCVYVFILMGEIRVFPREGNG